MIDIMDVYKSLNISTLTVMKNPRMLKFIPDYLKTKKCVSMQLKNDRIYSDMFLIYIRLKKAILENNGTLKFVPGCYKNREMCNKAADNYLHALEFVSECYKT